MDMLGYAGGQPRLPLLPPSEEALRELRGILERAELLRRHDP
jgi:dihydrodipicolinate synthase/N-acetylneuraminate lyase